MRLAICSSLGGSDVALQSTTGITESVATSQGDGRSDLAVEVRSLLHTAGTRIQDVDEILLDLGPGSYTGLRVAVTFAQTIRQFLGTSVRTVTALELWALTARPTHDDDTIVHPILDARRQRYHHARLRLTPTAEFVTPPAAVMFDELVASIEQDDVVSADASLHPQLTLICRERGAQLRPTTPYRASALFDPRLQPRPAATALEPLYLMASYAE